MTEPTEPTDAPRRPGERLAKAIARAGLGSRRDAETWIGEGRVKVNGETVSTAAVNVLPDDRIEVDGRPLPARERTRLWLYHKPRGYVTTNRDPEGRGTVFDILPEGLPRVMTIGRLDINTEGLLLLTNDGGLARVLELPETGWLRRYRVRAFGRTTQAALEALKDGVTIDEFSYGSIEAEIERQKNDNVWLKLGLREGKNREVKRVAEHLGLAVNRLIRISFGPFQLGDLAEGAVEEVRTRTLAEQLGKRLTEEAGCDFESDAARGEEAPKMTGGRGAGRGRAAGREDERARLTDPSQRVGRRAPVVRPRDMAPPASAAPAQELPTKTKRGEPIADRRGRKVAVERVARTDSDPAPKRFRKRDEGAAERFGAAGRAERPRFGDKPQRDRPPRDSEGRGGGETGRPPRTIGDGERRGPGGGAGLKRAGRPANGPQDAGSGDARRFEARPRSERPTGDGFAARPRGPRPDRDRPERAERPSAGPRRRDAAPGAEARERRRDASAPRGDRPAGARPAVARPARRDFGDRPRQVEGQSDARPDRGDRPQPRWRDNAAGGETEARGAGPRQPRGDRPDGAKPARKDFGDRPRRADAPAGKERPPREGQPAGRPGGPKRPGPGGPRGGRPGGLKPRGPGGGGKGRPGGADRRR